MAILKKSPLKMLAIAAIVWFLVSTGMHFWRIAPSGWIQHESGINVLDVSFGQNGNVVHIATTNIPLATWVIADKASEVYRSESSNTVAARFSADGRILAVASDENSLTIWDTERKIARAVLDTEATRIVDFLPRHTHADVVILHIGELVSYDLGTGLPQRRLAVSASGAAKVLRAGDEHFVVINRLDNGKPSAFFCDLLTGEAQAVDTWEFDAVWAASSRRLYGSTIDGYLVGVPLPGQGAGAVRAQVRGGIVAVRSFERQNVIAVSVGIGEFRGGRGAVLLFDDALTRCRTIGTQWYYHAIDLNADCSVLLGATLGRVEWKNISLD